MTIIRHSIAFLKKLRRGSYQDPARDWILMMTLSLIAIAGLIVWDVWAFNTVARGGVIGAPVKKVVPAFDSAAIESIHSIFETRSAEEAKYVTGVYKFIDPSQ